MKYIKLIFWFTLFFICFFLSAWCFALMAFLDGDFNLLQLFIVIACWPIGWILMVPVSNQIDKLI